MQDITPVSVEFRDLVYEVPPPRKSGKASRILHGVSGFVHAGESLAILGPSGSGKTTLLNLLAGRSEHGLSGGEILFGGAPRTARTKRSVGYVMQDDLFFSRLTVRETLKFTARLRLPAALPLQEKEACVDSIIEELRLTRCQNTRIGDQQFDKGISGGERKRLNIANELLPNPAVLLADECTSGLDSSSAYTVIQLLRRLSRDGRTIVATIHQPSSQMFQLFDKVLLLASGRVAYFGTPSAVSAYFASIDFPFPDSAYNPADYMLDLIIDDLPPPASDGENADVEVGLTPQQLAKRKILDAWEHRGPHPYLHQEGEYAPKEKLSEISISTDVVPSATDSITSSGEDPREISSVEEVERVLEKQTPKKGPARAVKKRIYALTGKRDRDPLPEKYPATFWTQLIALGKRSITQKRGNMLQRMYIVQVVAVTIMCLLFWFRMKNVEDTIDDRLGALFFFPVFWSFFSVFTALYTFPSERAVLNKDRASGAYRLSAYYIAKTTVEIPAETLYPFIFCTIVYYAINLNPSFLSFLLFTLTLVLNVLVALSLGVVISAILVDVKEAQVLASVWILTSMLVGGYYINSENVPAFLRPFRYISFIKYTYEAMVRIELRGAQFECVPDGVANTRYSQNGVKCPITEEAVLEASQLDNLSVAQNIGILILWVFLLRVLGYYALKYLNRRHKPRSARKNKPKLISSRS